MNSAFGSADSNADESALRQIAQDFTEDFNSGDIARLMRHYGPRYIDVNLRHPIQSHAERRKYFEQLIRRNNLQLQVQSDEIMIHAGIAIVRGRIALMRRDAPGGQSLTTELRYMELATRTVDGWKAMWGIDGPVQEYVQEHDARPARKPASDRAPSIESSS